MIKIRNYEEKDWDAICATHDAARPDELKGSCDPRAFVPIKEDSEVNLLEKSQKIVALDGDRVVGFVGTNDNYLAWLYIHPDYYHQGIGRRLLRMGLANISSGAWTIVLAGNENAINLYKSEGFQDVKRFESDNAGYPCTCLRMERK